MCVCGGGQFVCLKVSRCYQTGGVAPPLDQPPPPITTPRPHSLPLLTAPGEQHALLTWMLYDEIYTCIYVYTCVYMYIYIYLSTYVYVLVFSQYPCLWTVGCGEPSPSHSPCTALHGPISSESVMQPPSHGRVGVAAWPPGPGHSFWGWMWLAEVEVCQQITAAEYQYLSINTSYYWWLLIFTGDD